MIFFLLNILNFLLVKCLTPISECTLGRITGYDEYESGGSCGFGVPKIYGAAPNEAFYNNGEKCGICYELVGPNGVLYFMVDSYCPVKGNEAACSGDMLHFDLHRNGFLTIADKKLGKLNVTFRMVACNHEGNIIVKTKSKISQYYYAFVVMNHVIGLKKVYYSFDKSSWIGLERQGDYNEWKIDKIEKWPLYLQFESISGEKVVTQINELKSDFSHDTGVQFSVPKDMYFNVDTLKQISSPQKENCCKLNDAFTNIYDEGKFLGEWQDTSNCIRNIEYTSECMQGSSKCIRVELVNWSVFQFYNRIKPETKKYDSIEFYIKSENACNNCLKLNSDGKSFLSISTNSAKTWEKKTIKLTDLEITEEKFEKFLFQGSKADSQIFYFDDIKLVKSSYVDNGLCSDGNDSGNKESDKNNNKENENENYSESSSGSSTALIVILIIILIIGIGVGVFFFLRYKRKNNIFSNIETVNKDNLVK